MGLYHSIFQFFTLSYYYYVMVFQSGAIREVWVDVLSVPKVSWYERSCTFADQKDHLTDENHPILPSSSSPQLPHSSGLWFSGFAMASAVAQSCALTLWTRNSLIAVPANGRVCDLFSWIFIYSFGVRFWREILRRSRLWKHGSQVFNDVVVLYSSVWLYLTILDNEGVL